METIIKNRNNENIENKYLNKIAIVFGKKKNKYTKLITDNFNENTYLVCVDDGINLFNKICDFHITTKKYTYNIVPIIITYDMLYKLGFKIIIYYDVVLDDNVLYNNYGITSCNFNNITDNEYKKIINFRNLFILYPLPKRTAIGLLNYFFELFDYKYNRLMFLKIGLKIITSSTLKYYDENYNIINVLDKYIVNNSIIMSVHPTGYDWIIQTLNGFHICDGNKMLEIINSKKYIEKCLKYICWQESLQLFANNVQDKIDKNITNQEYDKAYNIELLDKINYLMTPSLQYLKNLNMSKYFDKTIDLFYTLNLYHFTSISSDTYDTRISKILLTGVVDGGYISRKTFLNLKTKSEEFNNLIEQLPHCTYVNTDPDLETKYYNKLSLYKASFVGHHKYPLNFLLPKHIEILSCGCLGFFERNSLLKSQLGLEEFVHYIPCSDDTGKLIEDFNFYNDWINNKKAKDIAKNGCDYVRNKFGQAYLIKYMNFFDTC